MEIPSWMSGYRGLTATGLTTDNTTIQRACLQIPAADAIPSQQHTVASAGQWDKQTSTLCNETLSLEANVEEKMIREKTILLTASPSRVSNAILSMLCSEAPEMISGSSLCCRVFDPAELRQRFLDVSLRPHSFLFEDLHETCEKPCWWAEVDELSDRWCQSYRSKLLQGSHTR
jgi:hypothetical protein